MYRRRFLGTSMLIGASAVGGLALCAAQAQQPAPSSATGSPIRIVMAGYGPPTTSFSQGLKRIGDRLEAKFGDAVAVRYVYNVIDAGYSGADLVWLVDSGVLTLAYSTMSNVDIPELELAALPFLFSDTASARAVMDGPLGQSAAATIEASMNARVLGYFENGFRHVSNSVRPVRTPADLSNLKIRVLGTQLRTFELLGADPQPIGLNEAIEALKAGTIDGQENPFANTVTYRIHPLQRFHTATYHSYLSRPIFVHRPSFEAWPEALQAEMQAAVRDAVTYQRALHDQEEEEAAAIIREAGGEILELTPEQHGAFVEAVAPVYSEARERYSPELLRLIGRYP